MASSISPSTLTVTISEAINLNGQSINSKNELTISSVTGIDKRIVTLATGAEVTLIDFGSGVSAGTFIPANVKYVRVTNKDTVNYARIRVTQTAGQTFDTRLEAGKSFIMGNALESANSTGAAFSALVTANSINGQAYVAPIDLEIFVATTS